LQGIALQLNALSMKKEILELNDIKHIVDSFYDKVRLDSKLGPIFIEKIGDRWPEHLDKMYRFWQTILLNEHTYSGSPFMHHAKLPIDKEHFDQWLHLFFETIDETYIGAAAEEAKLRAGKMAEMFQYKLEYLKNNGGKA
tara:strand:+ start:63244 stop:63663 length:420 start_codon:yes stop_codon:yes gene_type:complete